MKRPHPIADRAVRAAVWEWMPSDVQELLLELERQASTFPRVSLDPSMLESEWCYVLSINEAWELHDKIWESWHYRMNMTVVREVINALEKCT